MRRFYYKHQEINYYKFRALLKMRVYLIQFLVGPSTKFETGELKEIYYYKQQKWVQIIYSNTNYKFSDHSFIENAKYCNTIEKSNETIKAAKAMGKTSCGTNNKKS